MNNKIKFLGTLAAMAAFALPVAASADVENAVLTVNNRSNTSIEEGDNVGARLTFDRDGEHVESISWELVGSGLPETCVDIDDAISSGGTSVRSFTIRTAGAAEGTWDVKIRYFGDGFYPDNTGASNQCEPEDRIDVDGEDEVFADRVTVFDDINDNQDDDSNGNSNSGGTNSNTGNGNGSGTGGNGGTGGSGNGTGGTGSSFNDFFDALCVKYPWICNPPATTTPPVTHSADCVQLKNLATGLMFGSGGNGNPWQKPSVVALQNFLISKGGNTIATGYYGMLTGGAYSMVYSQLQCHN